MGKGFVAAHVWRIRTDDLLASRDPLTYTFAPNVVWLPTQVAKLTDREGEFPQLFIQALSLEIFRESVMTAELDPVVERAWSVLPTPPIDGRLLPSPDDLNYFACDEKFLSERLAKNRDVIEPMTALRDGGSYSRKVVSTRYGEGLPHVSKDVLRERVEQLSSYQSTLEHVA